MNSERTSLFSSCFCPFQCGYPRSIHSCPTPTDCSLPGSSVHGILQGRILEWVAIPFSRGSSQRKDQTSSPVSQADSSPLSHRWSLSPFKGTGTQTTATQGAALWVPLCCCWVRSSQPGIPENLVQGARSRAPGHGCTPSVPLQHKQS